MRELHRHVDSEELEKYSMGTSSAGETALVEEHLLICDHCRSLLQQTDDYLAGMRTASRQIRHDERLAKPRRWGSPFWLRLAAVTFGVLLLVGVVLRSGRPPEAVVAVSLTALRGNGAGTTAPSGRDLILHPDLTGLAESASYRLEIVDLAAQTVRRGLIGRAQDGIKIPGLHTGQYFVRIYLPAGELLREYGLDVR